jgi:hypothetical protein
MFHNIDYYEFWNTVCCKDDLSEEFIREFQDKVHWNCISASELLTEEFIIEFKDKVYWPFIFNHQKLSQKFRKECEHLITCKVKYRS